MHHAAMSLIDFPNLTNSKKVNKHCSQIVPIPLIYMYDDLQLPLDLL